MAVGGMWVPSTSSAPWNGRLGPTITRSCAGAAQTGTLPDSAADAGGHQGRGQDGDGGHDFQRIGAAYQVVMSNMAEAKQRLEYWRLRYGLADVDLDRYR